MSLHDTSHDMYLPDKRAPKRTSRRKLEPGMIGANPRGTQAEKEAWLRDRMAKRPPLSSRSRVVEAAIARAAEKTGTSRHMILCTGKGVTEVTEARRLVSVELFAAGMKPGQIARALRVDRTSVLYLLSGKSRPIQYKNVPQFDPNAPDESGIWAI